MNKELIKSILKVRVELFDSITGSLPDKTRDRLKEARNNLLEALEEISDEYLEKSAGNKKDSTLRTVDIE